MRRAEGKVGPRPFICIMGADDMKEPANLCSYCKKPKPMNRVWHDCPRAQAAKMRLAEVITDMYEKQIGGPEFFGTPDEVRRLQTMRTGAMIAGAKVKDINKIKEVR